MPSTRDPIVSIPDRKKLIASIQTARSSWLTYAPYLDAFRAGLGETDAIPPSRVPGDVITMNSRFALRELKTDETVCYTLVYPEDEPLTEGKVSVLSPMGTALLGARVRDVVRWSGALGPRAAEVLRLLYQPEAAGDFDR